MKRTGAALIAFSLAISAGSALAAGPHASGPFDQVIINNETGELRADASVATRSREQVRAELAQAAREGRLIADNATGETFGQRYPDRYAHIASRRDAG